MPMDNGSYLCTRCVLDQTGLEGIRVIGQNCSRE
jgi:hypothetical protein